MNFAFVACVSNEIYFENRTFCRKIGLKIDLRIWFYGADSKRLGAIILKKIHRELCSVLLSR